MPRHYHSYKVSSLVMENMRKMHKAGKSVRKKTFIDERSAKLKPKTRGKKRNGGPGGYLKRNSASAKDIHRFLWVKRQIWCSPRSIARDMA